MRSSLLTVRGQVGNQMSAEGGEVLKSASHKRRQEKANRTARLRWGLSCIVGQWEFKVFPNFPVFWFPPAMLSCAGASTKKINPSGVNWETRKRPLIYKKNNGSKGLAAWSQLVWKKTVQCTSAGTQSFSVLVWRATTELTTWGGKQAHNWCQFSYLLAVWSLANYLISPCLRFCFCYMKHLCLPGRAVLKLGIKH